MVKYLRIYALFFQTLFVIPLAHASQVTKENQWDWVPRESLPKAQQEQISRYCQGSYVDRWKPTTSLDTNLNAKTIYRDKAGVVHLIGNAEVIKPTSTLQADKIEGVPGKYYKTNGNIILRQKGQVIRGTSGYISNDSDSPTEFVDAKFTSIATGQRGAAKSLLRSKNGIIFIYQGYYTTCEPTEDSWKLYGSSIELNPKAGFGTAENVQLRVHDIPVFYFPWLRFPLTSARQTGFLFPTFGFSASKGLSLSTPFYWNLAPNYDATITPNIVTNEGTGLDLEIRHLSKYGLTTYEQSTFDEHKSFDDSKQAEGAQTLLRFKTDQQFTKNLSTGLLYEDNPTENKYPDVNSTSIKQKDNYERSAYLGFNSGNFSSKATIRTYQTPDPTLDKPFDWKPRIDSSYRYATTYLNYNVNGQYTDFYDPDENNFDGKRSVLNQDISLNLSNAWGTFSPGILLNYRDYQIHNYKSPDYDTSLSHASVYFDSSVVFERPLLIDDTTWRQTLEPRLSYLNSPYKDQSLIPDFDASVPTLNYSQAFSHQRFNGNDRVGDTEQVTLGIESRLYDGQNRQRWAFKLGQIQYLKDRYINKTGVTSQNTPVDDENQSPLLGSVTYTGSNRFSLTGNVNYDVNKHKSNLAQVIIKTRPADYVRLDMSYLYTVGNDDPTNDAKQANVSTIFPVSQDWSVYLQRTYDFFKHKKTKDVAGVGYENCCVKVSLSYQEWLNDNSDMERGVFLLFNLRSLSTVGQNSGEPSVAQDYWNNGKVGY
ncbi:LPS-assembly protein LptD precursor [Marinomonas spartinae]|uniref:LPS-assembly protein LptD n=1 Tax=Marinomonas spartinae TaxID=1792290 RepID=A0A1A8T6C6_9GAMM|nr:LPS assembly protein LptD [Marinomonas spartinae]SBS27991.1 LPS-assembly protein LptD precursor [Marinomonas spartinae]SBS28686.1 LPS-assembly protein LptD precursor [Marinomonas spartinae]